MGLYKNKLNTRTGAFNLVPTNQVVAFKSGVDTFANLPITGNEQNDARIVNDTHHLYVWSGTTWIDQGDLIDLTWEAIDGKPSSTPANIDDAVTKKHTQGTDQGLDTGGINATTAADVKDAVSKKHTQNTDLYLATAVTNTLYVDGNRGDTYTANGTITKPFKKIQDAIDAAVSPSATNKYLIDIVPGAYYSDAIIINKAYITFRSCGVQGARISGAITVTNPLDPTPEQITFVGLRISGGLTCLASHIAINCIDCNVTGSAWVMNPNTPTDDEYLQVWGGIWYADVTLTNVYTYLMGGGYYSTWTSTNKEFNINNADINTPFQVTLSGTVIGSAYGNRAGSSAFILNTGSTLYMDADTEGGSVLTMSGGTLVRTTKASNISNDSLVSGITVEDALDTLKSSINIVSVNAQSDDYTLVLNDLGKLVDMDKATAVVLTIPKNSVVAFPIGTSISIRQKGVGQVTITPIDGDVTINNMDGLITTDQYAVAGLIKIAENTWTAFGALRS